MKIDFTPDPSLYPFQSRWFDSSSGRMHYIDQGTGAPIFLCHGNPTWSFLYRHIVRQLRGRFRCVAMDYLGFGLSERPENYGYTIEEHAHTVGELVDHLSLNDFIVMGQDWGGPIGTAVAVERASRIRGLVLGNTWFWPATLPFVIFSKIMSSRSVQRRIIEQNFFVERLMPMALARVLTREEMDHYRRAQPTPDARRGVAEMPRQILAARDKPALLVWGMRDLGFRPGATLPRMRTALRDHVLVELPRAKHYIQEDAPEEIADAIAKRFG